MKRPMLLMLAALLLAALPGQALAAPGRTAPSENEAVVSSGQAPLLTPQVRREAGSLRPDAVTDALDEYWTPQRMRSALPALRQPGLAKSLHDHKRAERAERTQLRRGDLNRAQATDRPEGPAERIEPAKATVAKRTAGAGTASELRSAASWTPTYASGHPVARTNGKVFFTNARDGRNYVCSGAVINSEGRDTVWTAGHCVHGGSGGNWHTNWVFVPAYKNGAAPYGFWSANQLWSMGGWTGSSKWDSDMGVAIMNIRAGWHIVSRLGGQGISWNHSKYQYVYAFGYPSQSPFTGGVLVACYGRTSPEWVVLWWSSETIGLRCDMTKGSSGGPWLRSFDGSWGYLNGVNSFKYDSNPSTMYSPYFDNTARDLYNATRHL